jgi:hypothetical protein
MTVPAGWPFPRVINDMSELQRMFDRSAEVLLKQEAKAMRVDMAGTCVLRDEYDRVCAVGALIDESYYMEKLEGLPTSSNAIIRAIHNTGYGRGLPDKLLVEFLLDLQDIHDMCPVSRWPDRFLDLAKKYNLGSTVLEPYLS